MRISIVLLIGALSLLGSCSSTNDVVRRGPFQKRKYLPGWHVDLPAKERSTLTRVRSDEGIAVRTSPRTIGSSAQPTSHDLVAALDIQALPLKSGPRMRTAVHEAPRRAEQAVAFPTSLASIEPTIEHEPRRWNRMALVSGVFLTLSIIVIAISGGGGILPYLFTFSIITGIVGLVLAIKHRERGKGIAIAAIALPVVVFALVIAALNAAW